MKFSQVKKPKNLNIPYEIASRQPIVFFDGECSLCSSSVRFLLRHNPKGNLTFSSLQSPSGIIISSLAGKSALKPGTILYLQENRLYEYSTAILKIVKHLGFPWKAFLVFGIIPAILRDHIYRIIAKNRYRWFGKESFCLPMEKDYSERIL